MIGQTNSKIGDKINGAIKDYVVKTGETIAKGDFVSEQITTSTGTSVYASSSTHYSETHGYSIAISSTKFVAFYYDSGAYKACIGTISGSTITLDTTNAITIETSGVYYFSACLVDTRKIFICYGYNNASGVSRIITIDDTFSTLTKGDAYEFFASYSTYNHCSYINNNKIIIGFYQSTVSRLIVGTISGTTITYGTAVSAGATFNVKLNKNFYVLGTDKLLFLYRTSQPAYYARVITLDGNTITLQTALSIATSPSSAFYICGLQQNNNVVFGIYKSSTDGYMYYKKLTISDNTVSSGSEIKLSDTNDPILDLDSYQINLFKGLVFYTFSPSPSYLKIKTINIYNNGLVITSTSTTDFSVYNNAIFTLMSNYIFVFNYDTATSSATTYFKVFNVQDVVLGFNLSNLIGVAKTGGNAGDTIKVYVPE